MAVGVLSLQGAVREHLETLRRCGVEAITVRTPEEVVAVEGLILPGGESTTIGKLMVRYGLQQPMQELVASGRPLLGTCAGMILMAKTIQDGIVDQPRLAVMDIAVQRNAFGRQVDSFETDLEFKGIEGGPARAVFIRAPVITGVGDGVEVLATHEGTPVAARQRNLLVLSFHPELTGDTRVHEYFLAMRTGK